MVPGGRTQPCTCTSLGWGPPGSLSCGISPHPTPRDATTRPAHATHPRSPQIASQATTTSHWSGFLIHPPCVLGPRIWSHWGHLSQRFSGTSVRPSFCLDSVPVLAALCQGAVLEQRAAAVAARAAAAVHSDAEATAFQRPRGRCGVRLSAPQRSTGRLYNLRIHTETQAVATHSGPLVLRASSQRGHCAMLRRAAAMMLCPSPSGLPPAVAVAPGRWVPRHRPNDQCFLMAPPPCTYVINAHGEALRIISEQRDLDHIRILIDASTVFIPFHSGHFGHFSWLAIKYTGCWRATLPARAACPAAGAAGCPSLTPRPGR